MIPTVERARGRWREILPRLGIETRFLVNKHGPCPLCGGRDRYRFDDRNGEGTYFCSQCGAGCGIILVRKKNRWDYRTACNAIDDIIGTDIAPAPIAKPTRNSEDTKAHAIERLLGEANDPGVVAAYLAKRGLRVTSAALRGHSSCPYYDGGKYIGRYPAIVAPVLLVDGRMIGGTRIYDADVKPRKKAIGEIGGGAVRLHPAHDILGVAEGVETALAVHEMFAIPVWAALNEDNLQKFEPPAGIRKLIIFGDNDSNYVGQHAVYSLARRISRKKELGITVEVNIPPDTDSDWNDILIGGA